MRELKRSDVQEALLTLYLRLNGYFTTGFVVHSGNWGNARTEIDALAVRFPYNDERERQMPPSSMLAPPEERIDLLVCEVKSTMKDLHFNSALYNSLDPIKSVLRWAGMFQEQELEDLAPALQNVLQAGLSKEIVAIEGPRNTQIRALLCCPECFVRQDDDPWYISGEEIFQYCWQCLCPDERRDDCSTRYNFNLWGELGTLVRYFKDRHEAEQDAGEMSDLYQYFGLASD